MLRVREARALWGCTCDPLLVPLQDVSLIVLLAHRTARNDHDVSKKATSHHPPSPPRSACHRRLLLHTHLDGSLRASITPKTASTRCHLPSRSPNFTSAQRGNKRRWSDSGLRRRRLGCGTTKTTTTRKIGSIVGISERQRRANSSNSVRARVKRSAPRPAHPKPVVLRALSSHFRRQCACINRQHK